jgi:hypothetical protein
MSRRRAQLTGVAIFRGGLKKGSAASVAPAV